MSVKDSVFMFDEEGDVEEQLPATHVDDMKKTALIPTPIMKKFGSGSMPRQLTSREPSVVMSASSVLREASERRQPSQETLEDEGIFIDEFGFLLDEEQKEKELLYAKKVDNKQILRREVKWANMAAQWDNMTAKQREKVKERCRKGIPSRFRSVAWQLLVGSRKHMSDPGNRGTYDAILKKKLVDDELENVIERDLSRTFPKNIIFMEAGGVGQKFLRNVLHAYACIDPEVGYVQGMGFVVAALSTQLGEEETFWALHTLMNNTRYKLRELYRPGFPMLQQFFYQLKKLMARLLPKLHAHFEKLGVEPVFYASQWFLTLFVYHLNFRLVLRIWDIFLCEGWKIIFRVAIALLKAEEKRLLKMDFNDTLPALKSLHKGMDSEELIRYAHGVTFKTSELRRYADEYLRTVKEQ